MDPVSTIFQSFTAYQRTGALKGAIELDLFRAVAEGSATPETIAARCKASPRGVRILCDYLTVLGFLRKTDDGYALDPDTGPLLDPRSPLYVGSAIRFLASPIIMQSFADIAGTVRKGGTLMEAGGATEPENPMWVEFARAMAPLAGLTAPPLAHPLPPRSPPPPHA